MSLSKEDLDVITKALLEESGGFDFSIVNVDVMPYLRANGRGDDYDVDANGKLLLTLSCCSGH
jgi:hypothetical protein